MDDANLDLALEGVLFGAFGTSGQRCTATSRLILHERGLRRVPRPPLERVSQPSRSATRSTESTDMGPVASADQETKVLGYIEIGRKEGGAPALGGRSSTGRAFDRGFFLAPTVFETATARASRKEEIFGPVLSVIKVRDYDEAVRVANDVDYGLSSSIYTRDVNRAFRAVQALEAGITYVNAPTIGAEVQLPFGGVKNTGNGGREAGFVAIEEFTELKTVFVDFSDHLQKAQIDPR